MENHFSPNDGFTMLDLVIVTGKVRKIVEPVMKILARVISSSFIMFKECGGKGNARRNNAKKMKWVC